MVKSAAVIFRDFETDGVPTSGKHAVKKADARAWGTYLESLANLAYTNGKVYETVAALNADLASGPNTPAIVTGNPGGLYQKLGASGSGSWKQLLPIVPGTQFVTAADVGSGTANAIKVTTDLPVSPAGGQIITANIFRANTDLAPTISFNGGPALTIRKQRGGVFLAGELPPIMQGFISGSSFQSIFDLPDEATLAAIAQIAETFGDIEALQPIMDSAVALTQAWAINPTDVTPGNPSAKTSADVAATAAFTASTKAGEAAASAALAEASRLAGASIGYATKAAMDADLAHGDGTLALVTNDSTAANNITYRKSGASGAGSWVASADRVSGVIAATATYPAVSALLLDTAQLIGFTGALVSGPNGSAGTYTLVKNITASGRGIRYRYWANVAGTLRFQLATKSGDTITIVSERTVVVAAPGAGLAEFLDLEYQTGQYVGVRVSATGVLSVVTGTDPDGGWYYTNSQIAAGGTYNGATATTNTRLNHGIELLSQVVTGPAFTAVKAQSAASASSLPALKTAAALLLGPAQTIGYAGDLPTAANGSAGSYVFAKPVAQSGVGVRYSYMANIAGTIRVQTATKSGDTFTIVDERAVVIAAPGAGIVDIPDLAYTAGQYMGVRVSAAGVLAAAAGTDPDGGWWYTNAQVAAGGSFVDASLSTTVRMVHTIELLAQVVTGDRFAALEEAVLGSDPGANAAVFHVHLALGESHVAGVPTTLSPVKIPAGRGYCYRRATENLGHLQDPTGNSATAIAGSGRGSMFVSLGKQVLQQTDNVVGAIIVNSGEGGTTADTHWAAAGSSWLQAVTDWGKAITAIKASKLIVSGVSISIGLGSNNAAAGTTKANFKAAMLSLIARARTLVGAGDRVPVILVQTGSYADGSYAAAVLDMQAAQAEIVRDETNVYMGYSARYAVDRGQMLDNVHMVQPFYDTCGLAIGASASPHGAGLRPGALG